MSASDREFQRQINARIEEFVADITQLAREHAYRSLASALEVTPERREPARSAPRTPRAGGRRKRGQEELALVGKSLLEAITSTPGQRIQDLASHLALTPKELALPAKRLIAEKKVRTEGQKRSTAYFPTARGKKAAGR